MRNQVIRHAWLSGHAKAHKYAPLSRAEETRLIHAWQLSGDLQARDRIILSFLPLATPFAKKAAFRKGGAANRDQFMADFMHEAVLGLLRAIDRYDPEKGFRFSTYARWWIVASINNHLIRSHSLVPFVTSPEHKRLFFRLGQELSAAEAHLRKCGAFTGPGDAIDMVAERLDLPRDFLANFAARLSGDHSLNATSNVLDSSEEYINLLESEEPGAEDLAIEASNAALAQSLIHGALTHLTERERDVIRRRRLVDETERETLSRIGQDYGVTTERVRQIEMQALTKLRKALDHHQDAFS